MSSKPMQCKWFQLRPHVDKAVEGEGWSMAIFGELMLKLWFGVLVVTAIITPFAIAMGAVH